VAFDDAGELGPSYLDTGTPYAGCKVDASGKKYPEYEVSTKSKVDQTACTAFCAQRNIGQCTFFSRTSPDAIAAKAAHSGAVCGGYEADSCIVKLHKYTGKPIWATTTVNIRSFQATAEGVIGLGPHKSSRGEFGRVRLTDANRQNAFFDMLVDKDTGKGMYVQGLFGPSGSTHLYASAADQSGNVFAVMRSTPQQMYSNWMSPIFPQVATKRSTWYQMLILKINTAPDAIGHRTLPECIASCGGDVASTVIRDGYCWIEKQCFSAGESNAPGKKLCQVCDPSSSKTEWSLSANIGVSECFVDNSCVSSGATKSGMTCQQCDPPKTGTSWTTNSLYIPVDKDHTTCVLKPVASPPLASPPQSSPQASPPQVSPPQALSPQASPLGVVGNTYKTGPGGGEDGLTGGQKVGIGVGVGLGGTILLLVAYICYDDSKKRARMKDAPNSIDTSGVDIKPVA